MEQKKDENMTTLKEDEKMTTLKAADEKTCCDAPDLEEDSGFLTCRSCGLMGEQILDLTAEWRKYGDHGNKEDPTRCGAPIDPLLPISSMGVLVGSGGRNTPATRRLRHLVYSASFPARETTMLKTLLDMQSTMSSYGLPQGVQDAAKAIYVKQYEALRGPRSVAVRGGNLSGMKTASVMRACELFRIGISMLEVNDMFGVKMTHTSKASDKSMSLLKEVHMDVKPTTDESVMDMVCRFCSRLKVADDVAKKCQFLGYQWRQRRLDAEFEPKSIAAALIQCVIEEEKYSKSRDAVSKVSGTTRVTIRKCQDHLMHMKDVTELLAMMRSRGGANPPGI
jgi:transcription initiation factor TFIIB